MIAKAVTYAFGFKRGIAQLKTPIARGITTLAGRKRYAIFALALKILASRDSRCYGPIHHQ